MCPPKTSHPNNKHDRTDRIKDCNWRPSRPKEHYVYALWSPQYIHSDSKHLPSKGKSDRCRCIVCGRPQLTTTNECPNHKLLLLSSLPPFPVIHTFLSFTNHAATSSSCIGLDTSNPVRCHMIILFSTGGTAIPTAQQSNQHVHSICREMNTESEAAHSWEHLKGSQWKETP